MQGRSGALRGRVLRADVEHEFPVAGGLLFPDGHVLAVRGDSVARAFRPELPWAGRVAEVACARDVCVDRLPRKQSATRRTLAPRSFSVDGAGTKDDAVVCEIRQKCLARTLLRRRPGELALGPHQRLQLGRHVHLLHRRGGGESE
jgi:hypothetical protein